MLAMLALLGLIALGFFYVDAVPTTSGRIVGGAVTTIDKYPFATALLYSYSSVSFYQACGGTVLTTRAILSAGHCVYGDLPSRWRVRVGSSRASSGGNVHILSSITVHPSYNTATVDNDVSILRTASTIVYIPGTLQPASIAGSNYNLADNQAVIAIGWGVTSVNGAASEELRHVQIWTVNQTTCRSRYAEIGLSVSENMLCSGWLDQGGRDQCQGDSGGPLVHNGVVVGICSWGNQCALARYPGVNTRVSSFTTWIQNNA